MQQSCADLKFSFSAKVEEFMLFQPKKIYSKPNNIPVPITGNESCKEAKKTQIKVNLKASFQKSFLVSDFVKFGVSYDFFHVLLLVIFFYVLLKDSIFLCLSRSFTEPKILTSH